MFRPWEALDRRKFWPKGEYIAKAATGVGTAASLAIPPMIAADLAPFSIARLSLDAPEFYQGVY